MTAAVFYLSSADGPGRAPVPVGALTVFVRAEPVVTEDLLTALDQARPRADEVVMNSHALPVR